MRHVIINPYRFYEGLKKIIIIIYFFPTLVFTRVKNNNNNNNNKDARPYLTMSLMRSTM